jgi:hypothetical protein
MEYDALKSAWQSIAIMPKTNTELNSMMQESAHPVLKRIRRQLIIESTAFTVFLFVYYDFFDGDRKPLYVNVLLVAAVLLVIMHNIMGYMLTRRRIKGDNIKQSLKDYLFKMKVYAVASIASRVLAAGCLLLFFTSVISFTMSKYLILTGMIFVFIVQVVLLLRIWMERTRRMKEIVSSFF